MTSHITRLLTAAAVGIPLAVGALSGHAADKTVTIGYQTGVDPAKVAIADGTYEQVSGWTIDWRKFDSGVELETIFIAALLGDSEALVVRNGSGIEKPEDLVGKKVAVPFVSTTHYSLIAALQHWGIDPATVDILNLRPPEIAAAWQRGDIDATYVWDPALGKAKETGRVLISSADVATWGNPTFDAYIARKDFADANADFVTDFVRVTNDAYASYRADPAAWTPDSANAAKIVQLTGVKAEDVPVLLTGSQFPLLDEQASADLLGGGTAKAILQTARFLKDQGKIPEAKDDYSAYVNARFVLAAAATN